jgi:glycosyltransferase involved in cell wall biosynthesis
VKIALVGPAHPYKGGGARHTTELAGRLAAAGHDVVICSWRAQYPQWLYPGQQTIDVPEGAPYPRTGRRLCWYRPDGWLAEGRRLASADLVVFALLTPLQVPAYLAILAALRRKPVPGLHFKIVRQFRPSERPKLTKDLETHAAILASTVTGAGGVALRPGPVQRRPRTAVICHNVLPHERRPGDVTLTRTLLSHVDTVIVHSAEQAKLARELAPGVAVVTAQMPPHLPYFLGGNDPPQTLLPRGDDPPQTPPAHGGDARPPVPPRPPDYGGDGRLESSVGRLLFFGIVRPYKGLDVLLRALARGPGHLTLTVAGEFWGGTRETEKLIAELGIGPRVRLRPGYLPADEIPALFAAADVLVLPYREATASQNALLAFAHGVPVITTTAGALGDLVRDGVDGLTCAPGDTDDLVRALTAVSAPGVADRLRAGISDVDPEPCWAAYLQALPTR